MLSGKLALGGLSLEFGNAKERFAELSAELSALTERESRMLDKEHKILEALARTYLPELSESAVANGLVALRKEMDQALSEQAALRNELSDRIDELPEIVLSHERLLAEAERAEEMAAQGVERVRAEIETDLGRDAGHGAAVAEHRELLARRSVLAARHMRLKTTASVERRKYDADRAFSYLRHRRFGEPDYRGGFVARRLDAWLARRIDFEQLASNRLILEEGPKVVTLELRDVTDRARRLESQIDRQESEAGSRHGLVAALSASASAQEQLRDARVALTEARERYDRLASEIRAVDANRGRPYEDALEQHREFLASQTVTELVELARTTPDPKDDGLVARLDEVRSRLDEISTELRPIREQLETMNARTTSLGDFLRRAAESFSSRRSYFSEEASLPRLASSVMTGASTAEIAFEKLASSHRKQPLLVPKGVSSLDGLLADLSATFDKELGAVRVRYESEAEVDSEVVVYDHHGRVLHRRLTRRGEDVPPTAEPS